MPKLRIDFAAPEHRGGAAGWWVLGIALASAAGAGGTHYRVVSEAAAIEARLDAIEVRPREATVPIDPGRALQLRKRAESAGRIVDSLEHPWIGLLDDIETAGVRGISLLSLEPDADKLTVRLSGEAVDRDALSRYLERLGEARSLREVRLSKHEWQQRGAVSALRFAVSARWARSK